MTTCTTIILILLALMFSVQFVRAIERNNLGLMLWFGIEIVAYAYLLKMFFN